MEASANGLPPSAPWPPNKSFTPASNVPQGATDNARQQVPEQVQQYEMTEAEYLRLQRAQQYMRYQHQPQLQQQGQHQNPQQSQPQPQNLQQPQQHGRLQHQPQVQLQHQNNHQRQLQGKSQYQDMGLPQGDPKLYSQSTVLQNYNPGPVPCSQKKAKVQRKEEHQSDPETIILTSPPKATRKPVSPRAYRKILPKDVPTAPATIQAPTAQPSSTTTSSSLQQTPRNRFVHKTSLPQSTQVYAPTPMGRFHDPRVSPDAVLSQMLPPTRPRVGPSTDRTAPSPQWSGTFSFGYLTPEPMPYPQNTGPFHPPIGTPEWENGLSGSTAAAPRPQQGDGHREIFDSEGSPAGASSPSARNGSQVAMLGLRTTGFNNISAMPLGPPFRPMGGTAQTAVHNPATTIQFATSISWGQGESRQEQEVRDATSTDTSYQQMPSLVDIDPPVGIKRKAEQGLEPEPKRQDSGLPSSPDDRALSAVWAGVFMEALGDPTVDPGFVDPAEFDWSIYLGANTVLH